MPFLLPPTQWDKFNLSITKRIKLNNKNKSVTQKKVTFFTKQYKISFNCRLNFIKYAKETNNNKKAWNCFRPKIATKVAEKGDCRLKANEWQTIKHVLIKK